MGLFLCKNVGGVIILLLCTLSDDAFIVTKFCELISEGINVIERHFFQTEIV